MDYIRNEYIKVRGAFIPLDGSVEDRRTARREVAGAVAVLFLSLALIFGLGVLQGIWP